MVNKVQFSESSFIGSHFSFDLSNQIKEEMSPEEVGNLAKEIGEHLEKRPDDIRSVISFLESEDNYVCGPPKIFEKTPLIIHFIENKLEDVACLLIKKGIDFHTDNYFKNTALHKAVKVGSFRIVEALAEKGASLTDVTKKMVTSRGFVLLEPVTPLGCAVSSFEEIQRRYERHDNGSEILKDYNTRYSIFLYLLDRGNVNDYTESGRTLLSEAIMMDIPGAPEELLKRGADVNLRDCGMFPKSPLYYAVYKSNSKIVEKLMECGAKKSLDELYISKMGILERGDLGNISPLHLAVKKADEVMVRLLLELGADPNIQNPEGITPFQDAVNLMHTVKKVEDFDPKDVFGKIATIFPKLVSPEKLKKTGKPFSDYKIEVVIERAFAKEVENLPGGVPCMISPHSEETEKKLRETLEAIFSVKNNPVLSSLLSPILAMVKKEIAENSAFRIFVHKVNESQYLTEGGTKKLGGCFDGMNLIHLDNEINAESMMQGLVHEMSHLAAMRIFNYSGKPYILMQVIMREEFTKACDEAILESKEKLDYRYKVDRAFADLFIYELRKYPEEKIHSECFVRIVEFAWKLYRMGKTSQEIDKALNEKIPGLYNYFKNYFLKFAKEAAEPQQGPGIIERAESEQNLSTIGRIVGFILTKMFSLWNRD